MLIYKSITADNPGAGGRVVSEQAGERASEQSEWVFGRARERVLYACITGVLFRWFMRLRFEFG